jgi:glucans biosynthesis protein
MRLALRFLFLSVLLAHAAASFAFGFEDVAMRARRLAEMPYQKPDVNLPKELANMNYDEFRDIRYRPDKFVWRDAQLPFELAFFHRGFHFQQPVRIYEIVEGGAVREFRFNPQLFNYGKNRFDPNAFKDVAGFGGFRVHYPLHSTKYKDEVLVFLGASYFRALGKEQRYGISARGLAVDTGLASGEEFPYFTDFWIEWPSPTAKELVLYALLDSRRVSGAFRFVLKPGVETVVDVQSRFFLREQVTKLGFAPLTSMYFFGENQPRPAEDVRPEVHDSDGLSILSGTGEWIWRPLVNPKRLLVSSFALKNPQGFGIMQRDRMFAHYEDLEARYELRPSVWIEPKGQWGSGRVELVQIPSPDETNDNIVAFWVPDAPPAPKTAYDLSYRILWQRLTETRPPQSWVSQSRRGHGYTTKPDGSIGFLVDFEGPALKKLKPDAPVESVITTDSNAEVLECIVYPNEVTGGWRMRLRLRRIDDNKPVEMRAYLRADGNTLSETWSYLLPPT